MNSLPEFSNRVSLARLPTPLRRLHRLSDSIGVNIWLKCDDQTGSVLSGNKVRKLEFLLADALEKGADTVITCGGLQSNHCRATALACSQVGLACVLILRDGDWSRPEGISESREEGNLFLDYLSGASIRIFDQKAYVNNLPDLFFQVEQEVKQEGAIPYSIPTGGSNGIGVWGYFNAGMEIHNDCVAMGVEPGAVVCATGSGGTQTGLTLAAQYWPDKISKPEVWGMAVCDSADYFNRKVKSDGRSWAETANIPETAAGSMIDSLPVRTLDGYIGPGYAKPYPEVIQLIKRLAREEGVVLDPVYTGKAFHGMLQEIKVGKFNRFRDIVFVHTGGIFGLFPYAPAIY